MTNYDGQIRKWRCILIFVANFNGVFYTQDLFTIYIDCKENHFAAMYTQYFLDKSIHSFRLIAATVS